MMISDTDQLKINTNLKLGKIAPSVIHELSGVYSNFARAFKELLSNSYDADSTEVAIEFGDNYEWIIIKDNGNGMTPFEFQNDYLRIGTNPEMSEIDLTAGGRLKIGRKGIGFLALARFCKKAEIFTHTNKETHFCYNKFISKIDIEKLGCIEIDPFNEELYSLFAPFYRIDAVIINSVEIKNEFFKKEGGKLYITNAEKIFETLNNQSKDLEDSQINKYSIQVKYSLPSKNIDFYATIDYEYLLSAKDNNDIILLEDFSKVHVSTSVESSENHFTVIKLYLHDFIKNELKVSKRAGRVRNISSVSGFEKFIWNLSRNTPVDYDITEETLINMGMDFLVKDNSNFPFRVFITNKNLNFCAEIKRPFIGELLKNSIGLPIIKHPLTSSANGLSANGYIFGFKEPVFPGEMRGLSIRVRGVEIGTPGFLGIEKELPLKYRTVLDHIVGEINVTNGLDAIQTIMAGREGFYVEDKQYKILKKHLVGDSISDFGLLGKAIKDLIDFQSLELSAFRIVQEARIRRNAYLFISYALNNLIVSSRYGRSLRKLFNGKDIYAGHLIHLPNYETHLGDNTGNYKVELLEDLPRDFDIDFANKKILLSKESDFWKTSVFILGRNFQILLKIGKSDDALCELDFSDNIIYINWMHPTRGKIGDANFIKSALAWKIAYHSSNNDVDLMMNLALRLLSFSER